MGNRLRYIDFEKGICIIIMLYIHLTSIYDRTIELSFLHRLCIPQFAIIAGYNLHYTKNKSVLKIVSRMIYIYFVSIFVTQLIYQKSINLENALIYVLSGSIDSSCNIPLWYVPHYISLIVISLFTIKFADLLSKTIEEKFKIQNYYSYESMIIISVLMIFLGFSYKGSNNFFIKQSFIMVPFVMLGYVLNIFDAKFNDYIKTTDIKRKNILFIFCMAFFIICLFVFIVLTLMDGKIDIYPFIFNNIPLFYISTICGGICLFIVSKFICGIFLFDAITKIISKIARRSIYICCFSQPVAGVVFVYYGKVIDSFKDASLINDIVKMFFIIIGCIVLSCLFEREGSKNDK